MQPQCVAQCVIVVAFVATLWRLARALPWQNVAACAAMIALASSTIEIVGVTTGIPFGPFHYTEKLGQRLLGVLPWPAPMIWVVVLLNARGVARLILRPWRKAVNYGIWSVSLSGLLAALFDAGLVPVASHDWGWWIWPTPNSLPSWYGTPRLNFALWWFVYSILLTLMTPWLIHKRASLEPPPDCLPLFLWLLLTLLIAGENLFHQFWTAAGLMIATDMVVLFLVWKARRKLSGHDATTIE